MQGNTTYRGDIGLFRACLMLAGFPATSESSIFNDDSKAKPKKPTRRLKLWFADSVFNASQEQQWALEGFLREAFGDRIIKMEFIPGGFLSFLNVKEDINVLNFPPAFTGEVYTGIGVNEALNPSYTLNDFPSYLANGDYTLYLFGTEGQHYLLGVTGNVKNLTEAEFKQYCTDGKFPFSK